MKKIIYSIFLTLILFGCTEMLDLQDPTGPTGADFFKTERDVEKAVVAAYGGLTNGLSLWGEDMMALEQITDNFYNGSTLTDGGHGTWHLFQITPQNSTLTDFYRYLYIAINRANQVIVNAPLVDGITTTSLNNHLGQVHFLRAYEYFLLTLIFGDVPVILEPTGDPAGYAKGVSSATDVYDQIIADLKLAEQLLPGSPSESGRLVTLAASAMLVKVYLFGADELKNTSWYQLAQQKAEQVINSNAYALVNDPSKTPAENFIEIFSTVKENGPEDIFSIQHFNDGGIRTNSNIGTGYAMAISPRYNKNLNVFGYGWGYVYESAIKRWDNNDPRKDVSLWIDGEKIFLNGVSKGTYKQGSQQRPNARPKGGGLQKFWWAENFKSNNAISDLNMKVIRYADLLLMHAEADLMADGNLGANGLVSLNKVRNRAGLNSYSLGTVDRKMILDERRWELFGEAQRWFDLMRTRTAEQAFALLLEDDTDGDDVDKNGFVGERYYKMPYPQQALDRNPLLVQKPVWARTAE